MGLEIVGVVGVDLPFVLVVGSHVSAKRLHAGIKKKYPGTENTLIVLIIFHWNPHCFTPSGRDKTVFSKNAAELQVVRNSARCRLDSFSSVFVFEF